MSDPYRFSTVLPSRLPYPWEGNQHRAGIMDLSGILAMAIMFVLVCIFGTIGGLLFYLGMFKEILVNVGKPPIRKARIFYKFARGDYKESGALFEELNKLAPGLRSLGVYYDDPEKTSPMGRRYIIGSILEENGVPGLEDRERLKEIEDALKAGGFKETELPEAENAVSADFPWRTGFSVYIAVNRVYGVLNNFVKEKRLDVGPYVELYDAKAEKIHFFAPLDKQDQFYVLECLEAANEDDEDFDDLSPESGNDEEAADDAETKAESAQEEQ
ncbi:hypothetical protein RvY_05576 [Ramazzottius varieornatus]|uniref:Uncharacterized protein n=1 Tax=Ramazzottius varieornatus TaxID=947166 RepID=A0A1D1V273_RAMVA|nr:hypothetical protein RvY_05576 [Ramazzottius varieornatus]